MGIMEFRIRFPLYAEFRYLKRIVLEELPCVNLLFRLRGYRITGILTSCRKEGENKGYCYYLFHIQIIAILSHLQEPFR